VRTLQLAVNLAGWRIFIRRREDKAFLPVAEKILLRDNYTCQFCGFQAKEYQEIVNADSNYTNNKFSNLITSCCFCSQGLFIESIALDEMGGGQLIYLPEMMQAELNGFCHVLFCAMGNGTGYQETSQSIYRSFKFRSQSIENKYGTGASNPAVLGQLILERQAQTQDPDLASRVLKDLRLLPSYTKFKIQLEAWAAAALEELAAEAQQ
jgi:intracellular multiplication protein IcmJ